MIDAHGSTLRNLCGDQYLYSFVRDGSRVRHYVFTDGTFPGYHRALRHAEELFYKSRRQSTEEQPDE